MQHPPDLLNDSFRLTQDVAVPEPKHLKPTRLQSSRSDIIVRYLVEVLAAVQFGDQLGVDAAEIGDVRVDRDLPTELETIELPVPECAPEVRFGVGLLRMEGRSPRGPSL